jgi:hypothetical protein
MTDRVTYKITRGQPFSQWPPLLKGLYYRDAQAVQGILNEAGWLAVSVPKKPPPDVLKAIEIISNETQETFISSWLPAFVKHGIQPVITPREKAKHPRQDYQALIQRIGRYVETEIQPATGPHVNPYWMARLNAAFTPLRRELMASLLEFSSYDKRTKGAQEVFYAVAATAGIGYAIQTLPMLAFLRPFQANIMSQLDDYGNLAGEVASVKGQGYSWPQVLQSQWLAVPASLWGVFGDMDFEQKAKEAPPPLESSEKEIKQGIFSRLKDLVERYKPQHPGIEMDHWPSRLMRGMKFGLASSILSVCASVSTLLMMFGQHKKLVREGKVWRQSSPSGQASGGRPDQWTSFKEAFNQDIQYPARIGLFLGAAISITFAGLAALIRRPFSKNEFLLSMVLVQALVGAGESLGASIASLTARRRHDRCQEQRMAALTDAL